MEQIKSTYKGFEVEKSRFVKVSALAENAIENGVVKLYSYKPETNTVTVCKIDCNLRNIVNPYLLAKNIFAKWISDEMTEAKEKVEAFKKRIDDEQGLTDSEILEMKNLQEWTNDLHAIACKEETMTNFDRMIYFARRKKGDLPSVISESAKKIIETRMNAESPKSKAFAESVSAFVSLLSTKEEGNTLAFRFNANTRLLTEVYSVAYKARAIDKAGRVRSGRFSEKSAACEILLACIEELQRKQKEKQERDKQEEEKG